MNLRTWFQQGKLHQHQTSPEELGNLLQLVKRDIEDANVQTISADRRFATAYNAVLQLGTILLYCQGYKPYGTGHHFITFQAMKEILGTEYDRLADYFDSCRAKRNITDYNYAGGISEEEVKELIKEAESFLPIVLKWVKTNHPNLI
ncbi:MAG: hypothetical protein QME64_10120 [bacterium]|nr:hypothetical protein [bacterium]